MHLLLYNARRGKPAHRARLQRQRGGALLAATAAAAPSLRPRGQTPLKLWASRLLQMGTASKSPTSGLHQHFNAASAFRPSRNSASEQGSRMRVHEAL
jgi:hypothetical protein